MSEPQSPPTLSVVDPPPGEDLDEPRRGVRQVVPWLLLIFALAFAWMWLNQLEQTQRVERRATILESELSAARDDIAAYEGRMGEVRGGIEQVSRELDALRALAADPEGLVPGDGSEPVLAEPLPAQ